MRKTKEQKAITLIALIITIVVLLILAVVAINAVTGDGIIQHASNAKTEYEKAQDKENSMLSYYEEYLTEQTGWKQNGTKVSNGSITLNVGDYVNYVSNTDTSVKWRVLGAQNGKILLASEGLSKIVTLTTGHTDEITKLNDACKGYDDGEYAVNGSARSINVDDINRVTGYNPLKTGTGEKFELAYENGTATIYGEKVTYRMDNDGYIDYVLEENGIEKESGEISGEINSLVDVYGTRLVKPSEYKGEVGTSTAITVLSDIYGYYPTSLTMDENTTTGNGISNTSNAYDFLFSNTDSEEKYYWLASVATDLQFAKWGLPIFSMRCVHNGMVGNGQLSYANGTLFQSSGKSFLVRAVISLESNVNLSYDKNNNIWNIN